MVARTFHCDETRLRSFLDEELPADDQAELGDHLDICPDCRRTLERLAATSRLWGELPGLSPKGSRLHSPGFAICDVAPAEAIVKSGAAPTVTTVAADVTLLKFVSPE